MRTEDEAINLAAVVQWWIGSEKAEEDAYFINRGLRLGYITTRPHRLKDGELFEAYALTLAGFRRLADIGTTEQYKRAVHLHNWYATNAQ